MVFFAVWRSRYTYFGSNIGAGPASVSVCVLAYTFMRQSANQRVSAKTANATSLDLVWRALLTALAVFRETSDRERSSFYALEDSRVLSGSPSQDIHWCFAWQPDTGWKTSPNAAQSVRDLLDLYLPVCDACAERPLTVGHLGQSLDGHVATDSGDSCYVTGKENILHLHRMRALCDAVVVGGGTVAADDPQLTTRLVPGRNPVRVILDPKGRISDSYKILSDGQASTVLMRAENRVPPSSLDSKHVEVIGVPERNGRLDLNAVLAALHRKGLNTIFVEGGGVTVSGFLEAGLLDRLQIAIAPLIIGSGRAGLRTAPTQLLRDCLRPSHRVFRMGQDILFDCDLVEKLAASESGNQTVEPLVRII